MRVVNHKLIQLLHQQGPLIRIGIQGPFELQVLPRQFHNIILFGGVGKNCLNLPHPLFPLFNLLFQETHPVLDFPLLFGNKLLRLEGLGPEEFLGAVFGATCFCTDSFIGVRGLLISCATCRAIVRHAPSRSEVASCSADSSTLSTRVL